MKSSMMSRDAKSEQTHALETPRGPKVAQGMPRFSVLLIRWAFGIPEAGSELDNLQSSAFPWEEGESIDPVAGQKLSSFTDLESTIDDR
jgi:hypothetical protein